MNGSAVSVFPANVLIPAQDAVKPGIKNVFGYPAPGNKTAVADVADNVHTVTNTIDVLPEDESGPAPR
jgi:hypothetical protein